MYILFLGFVIGGARQPPSRAQGTRSEPDPDLVVSGAAVGCRPTIVFLALAVRQPLAKNGPLCQLPHVLAP